MEQLKTIEKNFNRPECKEYVKIVQTYDKDAENSRKYAVEVYIHVSDNLIATIHSAMLYKSDMIFDALVKNYI